MVRKLLLVAERKVVSVYQPEAQALRLQFSRSHRLLSSGDFQQVFDANDFRVSKRHFLILIRCSEEDTPRLGMVMSRKKVRFAVDRNRCKRIVRESFRTHQEQLKGCELIFLARPGLGELPSKELHKQLERQWNIVARKQQEQQKPRKLV